LVDVSKKLPAIAIKGGFAEGSVFDTKGVESLSKMPNRAALLGQIVTLLLSPGSRVASSIMSPASAIAGCIKTIVEKAEDSEKQAA
jgi:large subunit ribosomal protein L10